MNQVFHECSLQLTSHIRKLDPISKVGVEAQWKRDILNSEENAFLKSNFQLASHTRDLKPFSTVVAEEKWKCDVLTSENPTFPE